MKEIEVTTAQKVVIRYELASLRERILAWMIDITILGFIIGMLFVVLAMAFADQNETFTVLVVMVVLPVFLFYTLFFEWKMNGRTPGKRAVGLKVIRTDGEVPAGEDLLLRWVFRWMDIYTSFGAVSALLISAGDRSQRLGGLLSNTVVVRMKSNFGIYLQDIERMDEQLGGTIQYPQATQCSDAEMLAIKQLLMRRRKFSNPAHRKLVIEVSDALALRLGIKEIPENRVEFLSTVLRDYVVATR